MSSWGLIAGGIVGAIIGGPAGWKAGAMIGATVGTVAIDQPAMKKEIAGKERARGAGAAAQAEIAGRWQAIQQAPITAEQMELVMGAEKIGSLLDEFQEQDQAEPVIYYLPTAEPTNPFERINLALTELFA